MDERERQYREYMALREHQQEKEVDQYYTAEDINKTRPARPSVTNTPYGASELRKKQKEKMRQEQQMQEYLAARESVTGRGRTTANRSRKEAGRAAKAPKQRAAAPAPAPKQKAVKPARKKAKAAEKQFYNAAMSTAGKVKKVKKGNTKLKVIVAALLICVVLPVAGLLTGITMALTALGSMQDVPIDKNNLGIDPMVSSQLEGYRNIVVLGTDARADEDDSNSRSDAIIVASINEETNEVKMFSVFRDTLLDVGPEGLDKITHAYFYGGAQQSVRALNRNLDLNAEEVVVINWKTVADVIDAVGGIEIDVQESEIEEMNKYIPNTAKNVDGPDDLIEGPGLQTLNGVQAVTYSRIRKDALTGDYRRNERMKLVFSETFKKVKDSGFLTMFNVARKTMPEIRTNMSSGDILKMMLKFKKYDMTDSTTGFPYDVGSWTGQAAAGYAWYGPPKNLANNVTKLHEQFFNQPGYTPSSTVQDISNQIINKTGIQ